jgi:polyphosphate glucokinase
MPNEVRTGVGIDIGGSALKGAPVDLVAGVLAGVRRRRPTPAPATPDAVLDAVVAMVADLSAGGAAVPIGVTYPGVVQHGVTRTAANVDPAWIGHPVAAVLAQRLDRVVTVLNDADAAGLAEMRVGAGAGRRGVVVMVTLGTGIGTALFVDGTLVPNSELGHIEIAGEDAERLAAARVRDELDLDWPAYAARVSIYLQRLHALIWPGLVIVGGGVSGRAGEWLHLLDVPCEVVPAVLGNDAGIVGAALAARDDLTAGPAPADAR